MAGADRGGVISFARHPELVSGTSMTNRIERERD
jgi:hypothetical protein